jgi:uroporphyrinogen decarboxylase
MRLIDAVRAKKPHRLVLPLMGYPGAQLTRSTLKQNGFNSELHYRSVYKLVEMFAPDVIFYMMDLSVEAGAIGLQIRYPLEESASVEFHPVQHVSDLDDYKVLDPMYDARIRSYIETMRLMAHNMNDVTKGAYVIGPFTLAGLMIGASQIAIATIDNPDLVFATLNYAEDVITRYAKELVNAGADLVAILEPTATFLSPQSFIRFSGNYVTRIARRLDTITVLHVCGDTTRLVPAMGQIEVQGLSLDAMVDFSKAAQKIPPDMVLIGNLDPVRVMVNASPDGVRKAVQKLLDEMAPYENFILSTGCDLPHETPLENIRAFMEEGRTYLPMHQQPILARP